MMKKLTELQLQQEKDRAKEDRRILEELGLFFERRRERKLRALEAIPDEEWQAAVDADAMEDGAGTNAA